LAVTVGKSLLRIRHRRHLTQGEVGRTSGLATSYISRIENGHVQPTMGTLARLAKALGVQPSEIFRVNEAGSRAAGLHCPVSSSGGCIGEQIRAARGRRARQAKVSYGREELRILKMADYLALHGSREVRRSLVVLLESLMQRTPDPSSGARP